MITPGSIRSRSPIPSFTTAVTHRRINLSDDDSWSSSDGGPLDGMGDNQDHAAGFEATAPEIIDMNLPFEGVFHNLMLVSIRKQYAGHARRL